MGALKFNLYNKEDDNFETLEAKELVTDWLNDLKLPFEPDQNEIQDLEFKSRSGFIPYSHNRGGLDLLAISTVASIWSSGSHHGTKIEEKIEEFWNDTEKHVLAADPSLEGDALFDETYQNATGDYDQIGWRVRVMYAGNGEIAVFAGYDLDAPYFRGISNKTFQKIVKFKSLAGLAKQLKNMTKAVEASQNKPKNKKKKA